MKVRQYRDFAIDRRISMDVYADQLYAALSQPCDDLDVDQFSPRAVFTDSAENIWRARFNRYIAYPWQVRRQSADVHHVLDHGYAHLVRKLSPGRTICTVHDLIPFLRWTGKIPGATLSGEKFHRAGKRPHLNIYSLQHLVEFDHIISISKNTRRDLVEHFGLEESRISVVPLGVPSIFRPLPDVNIQNFIKRQGWQAGGNVKRILITGIEFYKNHHTALRVFEKVIEQADVEVRLIRAGQNSVHFDEWVNQRGLGKQVDTIFVSNHADMALLYNSVDCLLFPSLYEGFGMPVVEALACGTPVVTSNVASLPEITTDFVFTHDPEDCEGLLKSVLASLFETEIIQNFFTEGPQWSSQFLWSNVAEKTLRIYEDVLAS